MERRCSVGLILVAISVLLSDTCCAALVFDNGNHIALGKLASGVNHLADDFVLPADTAITDVHWKGVYNPGSTFNDDFSLRIYANSGFKPTIPIVSSAIYNAAVGAPSRSPTGEFLLGYTVYEYSASISPFIAHAGTRYWLELFNNADAWYWTRDPYAGNGASTELGDSWHVTGDEYSFQLFNIPEPPSFVAGSILAMLITSVGRWNRSKFVS